MSDIEIEIDGKPLTAKPNSMVIQVADEAGIYIPRFCYHKHLSIAANCRMCLVEVEKSPKALPACATPVMPGMKIFTRSPKALAAQKAVMEFLLINHPLDCPICDQGGECELQDLSLGYGSDESFYSEGKRSVKDKDIGPLVETEMTRCIHCTRCVRFGDEIAGLRELGGVGRGEHTEIGTYIEKSMRSEVSGNVIDLCPVGALTSKPFRFTARAWELNQYPSIAPHDCVGSNINIHTRRGQVMRVVPRENANINETWISDRDRFSYQGLYHADRLTQPLVKVGDEWQVSDWSFALEKAATELQTVMNEQGAQQLGALLSPSATLEEAYLLQKLMRCLGSSNIDHRLRQTDFQDQEVMGTFPDLNTQIADLENADLIILIGSNIQKEQPSAGLRVRKASRKGAKIISINMLDYDFNFPLAEKRIVAPHELITLLKGLPQDAAITKLLQQSTNKLILLGAPAFNHPESACIRALSLAFANQFHAKVGYLTEGSNSAGAWLVGAVPHRQAGGLPVERPGLNAYEMFKKPLQGYVLLNVEPEVDCANSIEAKKALSQAKSVIALSMFADPFVMKYATVILPIAPFTETSGTFVNIAGSWQSFKGVATPHGESRPAWKVLRVLGNLLHCEGFDFESTEEIQAEIKQKIVSNNLAAEAKFPEKELTWNKSDGQYRISRIGDIPIYATDSLVRRGEALQAAQSVVEGAFSMVRLNAVTAARLHIQNGDMVVLEQDEAVRLPVTIDHRVPPNAVWVPGGIHITRHLNELYGFIEVRKA